MGSEGDTELEKKKKKVIKRKKLLYKCIELTVEIYGGDSKIHFFFVGWESLGSQWTFIVLQGWQSDLNRMVVDMG